MDSNKLKKLRDISYTIRKTCGNCIHGGHFVNDWSVCNFHLYNHQKHSVSNRHLSINKNGYCEEHSYDESQDLEKFEEFKE